MTIVATRRVSQIFFLAVFLWFCLVMDVGDAWWQLRGWPVNWLIQLDPLAAVGTLLATGALHPGLLWSTATLSLTMLLGRFFCSWVCPFGTVHHAVGYLAFRKRKFKERLHANRYRPAQRLKYWLLIVLLAVAGGELLWGVVQLPSSRPMVFVSLLVLAAIIGVILAVRKQLRLSVKRLTVVTALVGVWVIWSRHTGSAAVTAVSLQTGLLDPLPFLHRSINMIVLPLMQQAVAITSGVPRLYEGGLLLGVCFAAAIGLNTLIPRFYCRFVCPLGALFGIFSRTAIWGIGKRTPTCVNCMRCEDACQGASSPATTIRSSECLLCMNCRPVCDDRLIVYSPETPAAGRVPLPDLSRREFALSLATGLSIIPLMRLDGSVGTNWNPEIIRPPGALPEANFLRRCLKCGQCMRICPTNVIQPAGVTRGLENLWTPVLNFRIGTSGCQLNCIACGHVCPTGAILPLELDRKLGRGAYASPGPIRIGTAFVDRGRCLPWAMNRPCIVCQENCPVSPKAIRVLPVFSPVTDLPELRVAAARPTEIELTGGELVASRFATGDYFCRVGLDGNATMVAITGNTETRLSLNLPATHGEIRPGDAVTIMIRLQQPQVDPAACIGCGTCEHECPVLGRRAIRVSAENQTREKAHALLV